MENGIIIKLSQVFNQKQSAYNQLKEEAHQESIRKNELRYRNKNSCSMQEPSSKSYGEIW